MKRNKLMAGALSMALAVPMLTAAASAAGSENVQATMSGSINVTYEGREQAFTDVNGGSVLPIVYQGTTYLPVRAVAGLAGLGVGWDQATNTVQLTTGGEQNTYDGDFNAPDSAVEVIISQDIAVTLDGVQQSFTDAAGTAVYPLVYHGTTYLPVRAVCGLVGVAVDWDQATSTVKLGEEPAVSDTYNADIPAGAIGVTADLPADMEGSTFTESGIVCNASAFVGIGTYFTFDSQKQYKTVTITVTAGSLDHYVTVVCYNEGIKSECVKDVMVKVGQTATIAADVAGWNTFDVKVAHGASSDALISSFYLTK